MYDAASLGRAWAGRRVHVPRGCGQLGGPRARQGLLKSQSVRNIPASAWILAVLSGGLQVLIFPRISLHFLCWVAMAPLLYALLRGRGGEGAMCDSEGRSLRPFTLWQGFLVAWASGLIWYLGTCYWVFPVMTGYDGLNALVAGRRTLSRGRSLGGARPPLVRAAR